jgi:phasin family protein
MATSLSPYSTWLDSGNPFAKSAQAQMEAVGEFTRISADAMRRVLKQQQDILLAIIGHWRDTAPKDPSAMMELPLEAARFGTEIALQNASELAEIARQAQTDMLAVLTARAEEMTANAAHAVEEGVKETGKLARKAVAKVADVTVAKTDEAADATADQIALAGKMVE